MRALINLQEEPKPLMITTAITNRMKSFNSMRKT